MSEPKKTVQPELDTPVRAHIGDQLRKFYSSIVAEPIPDRLTELLNELEKKEREAPDVSSEERR